MFLMGMDVKISNKILVDQIQQYLTMIKHQELDLFQECKIGLIAENQFNKLSN